MLTNIHGHNLELSNLQFSTTVSQLLAHRLTSLPVFLLIQGCCEIAISFFQYALKNLQLCFALGTLDPLSYFLPCTISPGHTNIVWSVLLSYIFICSALAIVLCFNSQRLSPLFCVLIYLLVE